jgi:hypothetical protein
MILIPFQGQYYPLCNVSRKLEIKVENAVVNMTR